MATTKKTAEKGKKVALPAAPAAEAQAEATAPAAEAAKEKKADSNSTDAVYADMYKVLDNEPGRMIGAAVRFITAEGESLAGQIVGHDAATGLTSIWVVDATGQQRMAATYHRTDKRKPEQHSCWELAGLI